MEDEILTSETEYVEAASTTDENGVTVNVFVAAPADHSDGVEVLDPEVLPVDDTPEYTVSVSSLDSYSLGTSGLPSVVQSIFGEYTPRTQTVQTFIGEDVYTSTEVVPGLAGLDYYWLAGVLAFMVTLCGFFSVLRVVLRKG